MDVLLLPVFRQYTSNDKQASNVCMLWKWYQQKMKKKRFLRFFLCLFLSLNDEITNIHSIIKGWHAKMMIALGDHAYYSVPLHPPLAHAHLHSESKVSSLTYDALPIVYYNMVLLHLNFIPEEERICRFGTHTHTHTKMLCSWKLKKTHTHNDRKSTLRKWTMKKGWMKRNWTFRTSYNGSFEWKINE